MDYDTLNDATNRAYEALTVVFHTDKPMAPEFFAANVQNESLGQTIQRSGEGQDLARVNPDNPLAPFIEYYSIARGYICGSLGIIVLEGNKTIPSADELAQVLQKARESSPIHSPTFTMVGIMLSDSEPTLAQRVIEETAKRVL